MALVGDSTITKRRVGRLVAAAVGVAERRPPPALRVGAVGWVSVIGLVPVVTS